MPVRIEEPHLFHKLLIQTPISIKSEMDLAKEIAKIANQAMALGYKLEDESRLLTKDEAYQQLSHSASLFKAILEYLAQEAKGEK